MRLPSFDESLFFDIRSFQIETPQHHSLLSNCSDGSCPYHVDVQYDWSTRKWFTASILPWKRREIVANEWKSYSHNSATFSISFKVRCVFNYKTKSLRRRYITCIDMHKSSIITHEISLRNLIGCSIFQL